MLNPRNETFRGNEMLPIIFISLGGDNEKAFDNGKPARSSITHAYRLRWGRLNSHRFARRNQGTWVHPHFHRPQL